MIRLLESIIYRLDTSEISIFKLVSVAKQAGSNIILLETMKTGFLATRPIWDVSLTNAVQIMILG